MHLTFDNLVEEIKSLSTEEKEELEFLLEKFLLDECREEIYKNYRKSLQEFSVSISLKVC
ncbi:MAG: hypothetical protein HZA78_04225 [Candidatus Schekmanbacteria bacterium]|nr:hypothetical protein [Candidatus Schekmanbacteria bacterium]